MKIIDLLNKIAKGEIPKKIKYDNDIWEYIEEKENYKNSNGASLNWDYVALYCLKEPVEILEEEKEIPEKINKSYDIRILDLDKPNTIKDYDMEQLIEMVQDIYGKQCEIIDYLKSKGE